jgi:hypothetical protein
MLAKHEKDLKSSQFINEIKVGLPNVGELYKLKQLLKHMNFENVGNNVEHRLISI